MTDGEGPLVLFRWCMAAWTGAGPVAWSQDAAGPRLSIRSYLQLSAVPPLMYEDFLNAKTLSSCWSLQTEWRGKGWVCLFYLEYLYIIIWNVIITIGVQLTGNVLQYFARTALWTHSFSDVKTNTSVQGRIKLFGAPRQWKHFRPLFQAVFLSRGGYYPPDSQTPRLPVPRQK